MSSSLTTCNEPHKRLILKISYSKKRVISSYWLDSTITLSQHKKNNVVANTDKNKKEPTIDHPRAFGRETKDNGEEVMKKVKKPMEHYKKMQCWVILKRMLEGRDGWALKYPLLDHKSKLKSIGLKDIESKLKLYSTPQEFADDMRFVFSQGLLYPTWDVVHKIATKFSATFENKWKSLNQEWTLEDRKLKRIHKRKREQEQAV